MAYTVYVGLPVPKALDGKGLLSETKPFALTKLDLTKNVKVSKI